jgi:hypothetical protein
LNEVKERIAELEHIKEVCDRNGYVGVGRWATAELAEMKVILKRGAQVNA